MVEEIALAMPRLEPVVVSDRPLDALPRDRVVQRTLSFINCMFASFFDSNDDGVGDFSGLTAKLDYLQELGVTALWLLPFYPSPLRDDGYDIADYRDVNPVYGTLHDFKHFVP